MTHDVVTKIFDYIKTIGDIDKPFDINGYYHLFTSDFKQYINGDLIVNDFDSLKTHIDEIRDEMKESSVIIHERLDGDHFTVVRFTYASNVIQKSFDVMAIFKIKDSKCSAFIESLIEK